MLISLSTKLFASFAPANEELILTYPEFREAAASLVQSRSSTLYDRASSFITDGSTNSPTRPPLGSFPSRFPPQQRDMAKAVLLSSSRHDVWNV